VKNREWDIRRPSANQLWYYTRYYVEKARADFEGRPLQLYRDFINEHRSLRLMEIHNMLEYMIDDDI